MSTVPTCSRHHTYGVFPENVMSGRVEAPAPLEIAAPPLTIWKWAALPLPTSRETNTWLTPDTVSSQATQGTVGFGGFIVPAATCGSSALAAGSLLSEHCASLVPDAAQVPKAFAPLVSRVPWSWFPTATQWKPPLAATPSLTPLAANSKKLLCRPLIVVLPVSYQTTHGTPSLGPVNVMSGSIPSRVGSTLRLGSALLGPTRGMPVCCQQNPPIAGTWPPTSTPAGFTPSQLAAAGPIGRSTKI